MDMKTNLKSIIKTVLAFLVAGSLAGAPGPARADTADAANAAKVKEALTVMKAEALKLGEPKADKVALYFGTTKMNGNYTIVDELQTRFSCTATFFVKKGDNYIRISTNVLNDGNRAVGTVLNPQGPAYAAIAKGEAYYGKVDILGQPYEAGYEPVKDTAGETVGVYYVGYLMQ